VRILIYSRNWAPAVGGVETIVMSLALGLAASPKVTKLTLVTYTPQQGMNDSELPFHVVRRPSFIKLYGLIRSAQVVHLAGPAFVPLLVAILLRKPTALEHHGFQAICPNGQLFYEPTETPCAGHFMASRHSECLRCNAKYGSLFSLKLWASTFPRRSLCNAATANIVPTEWLSSQLNLQRTKPAHHGAPGSRASASRPLSRIVTFAFQGRLVTTKGVRVILEACSLLKSRDLPFQLLIIGDGPNRPNLEALSQHLGIEHLVQFVGYLSPESLEEKMETVDAILMPSLAGEVFGMVALENMLRGKLVIVSDIGALTEVVGDTGFSCATGEPAAWAACMERVLRDPALCVSHGTRARQRALDMFSTEQMILTHLQTYDEMTGGARRS
jgi:glycosyltransferase involved in cell wall biosynthesis